MTVDFTVAIPTYNGATRLPQVLEKLRLQIQTEAINWEILVIDNNSTDNTAQVVQTYQQNWAQPFPLKYLFEPKQGLAFARQCAIAHASGTYVGFIDDDNLPAPDWVAEAFAFGQAQPQVGAYGGQIHGEFEVSPPADFKRIQSFLAIRERGSQPHPYKPSSLLLPPGAALVVRREAWCKHVPEQLTLIGRVNGSNLSGEDYEALLYLHKAGWQIWYCPTMHTYHQIPQKRLERDYLIALASGSGLSICQLRMIEAQPWQKPLIFCKVLLGSCRRAVLHFLKYRASLRTDLIVACEMAFLWSTCLSPFFYLRQAARVRFNAD